MPYGPFGNASIPGFILKLPTIQAVSQGALVCLGMQGAGPPADACTAIYQLAFEQARIALQPSPFERMLKPSWN
jgi:hypothetical protein